MNDDTRFSERPSPGVPLPEMPPPAQIDTQPQAPQQNPPQPATQPLHSCECPVAAAAINICKHEVKTWDCSICLTHAHADAKEQGWLHHLCICEPHNPTPRLDTPAGRHRLAGAVEESGATDLEWLAWARFNVTRLVSNMDAALERVLQARMAGADFISDDDVYIINQIGPLVGRMMPRMDDDRGGFSLDNGRITYAPCHIEPSQRGHSAVNRPRKSRAARQWLEDSSVTALRDLEWMAQQQQQQQQQQEEEEEEEEEEESTQQLRPQEQMDEQQQQARPPVVDGSAPHPPTTEPAAPEPTNEQHAAQPAQFQARVQAHQAATGLPAHGSAGTVFVQTQHQEPSAVFPPHPAPHSSLHPTGTTAPAPESPPPWVVEQQDLQRQQLLARQHYQQYHLLYHQHHPWQHHAGSINPMMPAQTQATAPNTWAQGSNTGIDGWDAYPRHQTLLQQQQQQQQQQHQQHEYRNNNEEQQQHQQQSDDPEYLEDSSRTMSPMDDDESLDGAAPDSTRSQSQSPPHSSPGDEWTPVPRDVDSPMVEDEVA